jgi:hypothetical protein
VRSRSHSTEALNRKCVLVAVELKTKNVNHTDFTFLESVTEMKELVCNFYGTATDLL